MHPDRIAELRCPRTFAPLRLIDAVIEHDHVVGGALVSGAGIKYPIQAGVIDFSASMPLTDLEARTQADYDRVAERIYDTAVDWQFAAMYEDEHAVRESMVDMLRLDPGARVLEIGCGTGRDSWRIARRLGPAGRLHLQDLSSRMVHTAARTMERAGGPGGFACAVDYSVSAAMALPFVDDLFDAVFHFGGFNQFGDLPRSAAELNRITKPGGRIVIGDEAVAPWLKGTEFEAIVTTNNPLFKAEVPLAVLPHGARDVVVRWIIGNCFYVIAFTKGDGPPPLNLDLPHEGWRGGTMRSRYFGMLEGVTPEAKALVKEAAARAGLSVHEWLDRVVKVAAGRSAE